MSGKKCRFPLRGVLKLRRHEMQKAEQELISAMKAHREQRRHVRAVRRRLAALKQPADSADGASDDDRLSTQQRDAYRREVRQTLRLELIKLGECRQLETERRAALHSIEHAGKSMQVLREEYRAYTATLPQN